jgi:hypothetical protein
MENWSFQNQSQGKTGWGDKGTEIKASNKMDMRRREK